MSRSIKLDQYSYALFGSIRRIFSRPYHSIRNLLAGDTAAFALGILFNSIVVLVLIVGLVLSRSISLEAPFLLVATPDNFKGLLPASGIVVGFLAFWWPGRRPTRILLLVIIAVVCGILNAIDLTFLSWFNQPAFLLYKHLPSPDIRLATLGSFLTYFCQYVPFKFVLLSLLLMAPAFLAIYYIDPISRCSRLAALLVTACTLAAPLAFGHHVPVRKLGALEAEALRVDPYIRLRRLQSADRSNALAPLDSPRFKPRTILLVVNENTSYFSKSSQDEQIALIDRLISLSGTQKGWNVFSNAVTNSSCTDVSIPSILTGSGPSESHEKLHQLPFIFDIAKARGYRTAFYTSSTLEWANFSTFFSSAKIDSISTAETIGLPLINDLAIDDIPAMKRLADFIERSRPEEDLFIVAYPQAMHPPRQSMGALVFPPELKDRGKRARFVLESVHKILFDALHASGRFDGALILETGDHGEPFIAASRQFFLSRSKIMMKRRCGFRS